MATSSNSACRRRFGDGTAVQASSGTRSAAGRHHSEVGAPRVVLVGVDGPRVRVVGQHVSSVPSFLRHTT